MRNIRKSVASLVGLATVVMGGCASIPAEQLGNYALVVPLENNKAALTGIDGRTQWHLEGSAANVTPGQHTLELTNCPDGINSAGHCPLHYYTFQAEAGKAYVLHWPGQTIDVFDRSNLKGPKLGQLHYVDAGYVNDADFARIQAQNQRVAVVQAQAMAQARQSMTQQLSTASKGTQVCRIVPNNVGQTTVAGFIEDHEGDKLQIRIAGITWKAISNFGFTNQRSLDSLIVGSMQWQNGSIIYDETANWSLCN